MSDRNKNTIEDKPLRSSPEDFNRFINSALWYDMRTLVKDRIDLLQKEFLSAESFEQMKDIQGQMKAWNEMLGIPSYLKSCAHKESNENQQSELEI